ncbi:tyrosine-protein phosphatase [Embleya sp. NBC_00896]|uniref:tyrosine-protein phosphatase n=1 Tax=Embleya sp. NBC_00896 TaxID=2975961 RepID=UPI003867C766|nr:tyrosine-protein phosphatase [Embleya sp. NBC_00896]
MSQPHRRHVGFARLHNFRDVGGYRTADGRTVQWGRLYRSDSLGKLEGADWDAFLALGVRTVIDLRYPWEIEHRGRVPEHSSLSYHNLSIEHRPYNQPDLTEDIEPGPYLAARFAEVAEDGVAEIREALALIAAADRAPVVFHCASGKDRTGLIAALVLSLLGVSDEDIVADFALTELATARLLADWRAEHGGASPRWPGFGRAPAEVMRLVLAGLSTTYGSPHAYVVEQLGFTEPEIATLRNTLLTSPAIGDPA